MNHIILSNQIVPTAKLTLATTSQQKHATTSSPLIPTSNGDLIDKEELRQRLSLPSTRMVDELMKRRKIPFLRLGHRTVRFSWHKVQSALSKFEYRAIGQ